MRERVLTEICIINFPGEIKISRIKIILANEKANYDATPHIKRENDV